MGQRCQATCRIETNVENGGDAKDGDWDKGAEEERASGCRAAKKKGS